MQKSSAEKEIKNAIKLLQRVVVSLSCLMKELPPEKRSRLKEYTRNSIPKTVKNHLSK